jgi:transposase-like protein
MPPIAAADQTEVSFGAEYGGQALHAGSPVPKLTSPSRRSRGLVVATEHLPALERWARSRTLPARLVLRARIVLLLAARRSVAVTATRLHTTPATVRLWRNRYVSEGLDALTRDRAGRGRKPLSMRDAIVGDASENNRSVRSLARSLGVSPSTISRWRRARRERQGS